MTIKVLLVDDEPPALERLALFLRDEPDVRIVGQCLDGPSAVAAMRRLQPDLVFLDVRLPGMDGFSVLGSAPGWRPLFIVVSAHAQHAPRAFEDHAVDYLLKPFGRERLRRALGRARERLQRAGPGGLAARLAKLGARSRVPGRTEMPPLGFRSAGRVVLIPPRDIECVLAAGDEAEVLAGGERHLVQQSLGQIQLRLPPGQFLRINRSTLVNIGQIKELELRTHGDCTVILVDGRRLPLTRRYRAEMDRLLG